MPKRQKRNGKSGKADPLAEIGSETLHVKKDCLILPAGSSFSGGDVRYPLLTAMTIACMSNSANIYTTSSFFDGIECCSWVNWAESNGFEETNQKATKDYAHRQHGRLAFHDTGLADLIFSRLSRILDHCGLISLRGKKASGCHPNLRVYRYTQGQSFGKHIDESNNCPEGETKLTVLIYLSDVSGGATAFYKSHFSNDCVVKVVPTAGLLLLHEHGDKCLTHEALPVKEGVKYVLRTDVLYNK